jgi:hypothetical protein
MTDDQKVIIPRPEAAIAAEWWASRLNNASHDIGDRDADEREKSEFANFAAALAARQFTDEQIAAFRRELAGTVEEHLRRWETGAFEGAWRPEDPQWGSALRSFGCDYHPEPVLKDAAERAGFKLRGIDLPMKTTMWVNPGRVAVAEGYGAAIVTVWEETRAAGNARTLPARKDRNPPVKDRGLS